ncbi:MAG: BACON domain-containing carbohydrate-binding protein [Paludibacter sp.]|nr:BACON domain-containing carbohydrate-binding protein [Paludibacter sp.]
MKRFITYLAGILFLGVTLSASGQKSSQKDIFGREIITAEGKKINYSLTDTKVLRPAVIAKTLPVLTASAARSAVVKTPFNAKVENMYSIMGTSIGRNSMHSIDIDNDGNVELICTASGQSYGSGSFWYIMRYDATDKTWNQVWTSPNSPTSINTLEVVDLNNNNSYEILVGYSNGTLEIYDGTTRGLIRTAVPVPEAINSIIYADADNDSEKEIVISGPQNTYVLNAATLAQKFIINKGANYVRVGKLDTSNMNEIVLSSGYIYKLVGSTLTLEWNYYTGGEGTIELSDIDSDSKQEVIFAQPWSMINVYDVDTKTTKYTIKTDLEIQALVLTDVNNDGIDEILYGDGQWGKVWCYNSVTHAMMWSVNNPEHGVSAINYADLNKDGKKELIWGAGWTSSGADYLYIYDVTASTLLWRSDDIVGPFYAIATGDVDGDGKDEVVAVSYESESGYGSGIIVIMDAQTKKLKWKSTGNFMYLIWTGVYDISIADIDNDGNNEIIIAAGQTYTGEIWIIDGKSHTIKSSHIFSTGDIDEFYSLAVEDVDNDGKKELIAANRSSLYVINPTDWSIKWNVAVTSSYVNPKIRCADLNGDGKKEIIVCKGTLQVINGADHSFWTSTESIYTNIDLYDFNNDGIQDIVASTSTGHIVVIDGATKLKLNEVTPETTEIASVRAYRSNGTLFYIYSCNGKVNLYQNDTNCNTSQNLGTSVGEVESLKLYNSQAASTEILIGTSISVLKMYLNVISVSTNNLTIGSEENSTTSFTVTTAKNWTISNNQSWLTLSSATGTGAATITLTARGNVTSEKRSATLTVTDEGSNSQVMTVTQDGANPVLTVSTNSVTIAETYGSKKSVDISSNMNWTATPSQNWLTVNIPKGSMNATLILTANANPMITSRTCTVTISGTGITPVVITIEQAAGPAALTVSANDITIAAPVNSIRTFVITSNIPWTATCDQLWLVMDSYSGPTNAYITITAQSNLSTETRSATLKISGKDVPTQTIVVTQEAGLPFISLSENTLIFPANNVTSFTIRSNTDWVLQSNQSWISAMPGYGSGNATVILTGQINSTTKVRAASLVVSGTGVYPQAITILQDVPSGFGNTEDNSLFIYPNPTVNDLSITNANAGTTITIYDVNGNAVISRITESTSLKIDVSSLAKGIYTIRLTDTMMSKTRKFIKQ